MTGRSNLSGVWFVRSLMRSYAANLLGGLWPEGQGW